MHFDHERLDVYRAALCFFDLALKVLRDLPQGFGFVSDQLSRASLSIMTNTAEGAGEHSRKAKASFYRIARRSATECAAILDACRIGEAAEPRLLDAGREQLLKIVAMLVRLAKAMEQGRREKSSGSGSGSGSPASGLARQGAADV
jgi:four helix bundle protein